MAATLQIVILVVIAAAVPTVFGLECYVCDSIFDKGCGKTFEVSDKNLIKVECFPNATACSKMVTENPKHDKQLVARGCWELNNVEGYTPTGCNEFAADASRCICTGDLCNGQGRLLGSFALIAVIVSLLVVFQ